MSQQTECGTGPMRILPAIAKMIAMAAGGAGIVVLLGPATADIAIDGMPLHQAAIGGGLIGLASLILAFGCWRAEPAVLRPLPADKAEALAQERRSEARLIIENAASGAPESPRA